MRVLSFYPSLLLLALLCLNVSASSASEQSARQIMDQVDLQQRQVSDSMMSRSRLSSCYFAVENKKVHCTEDPRVREIEMINRQFGEEKKDSRSISITLNPASERGIGMLTYSYDDPEKDTESWLYLSALGKVKRMASGTGEDSEPVSLFGSEFTTEDMESGKTDEYDFKLLQEGPYNDRPVWVIEAVPTPVRYKKTRYSKLIYWVDKERLVVLKAQAYNKRGELYKRIMASSVEQLGKYWMAREVTIYNMQKRRLSIMATEDVALGLSFEDDFLTQRSLTDFAYREQVLKGLRSQF